MSKSKTLAYLCIVNSIKSPGVLKKIKGTLKAASADGFQVRLWVAEPVQGFHVKIARAIDESEEQVLIIRSICEFNVFLIRALINAQIRKKVVIIDVPTPNRVALSEIWYSKKSLLGKFKSLLMLLLSGPIPYWFTNRIVQYADEGFWFLLGNTGKTKILGNGIDVEYIPIRKTKPVWPSDSLNLIMVASFNYWHGVGDLLKAIYEFNSNKNNSFKVCLKIVGKGVIFNDLIQLVEELELKPYVQFLGFLEGDKLYQHYDTAHLAIGSLALYKKKLFMASELKAREYTAIGIPFLAVGDDPDFSRDCKFRIILPNKENKKKLISFFEDLKFTAFDFEPREIRVFAKKQLDYSVKFGEIISGLV